jgi:hypothetical protein
VSQIVSVQRETKSDEKWGYSGDSHVVGYLVAIVIHSYP